MTTTTKTQDARSPRILVAGDVLREGRVFEGLRRLPSDWMSPGTRFMTTAGNAVFLAQLLKAGFAPEAESAQDGTSTIKAAPDAPAGVVLGLDERRLAELPSFLDSYEVWRPFSGTDGKVWRLAERLGYGLKQRDQTTDGAYDKLPDVEALRAPCDIAVLDDAGLLYRLAPQRAGWPAFLIAPAKEPAPRWVVLKTTWPLAAGDLWRALEKHEERLVVVLDVEDLRREEARITRGASWERTALDLVRELRENPALRPLLRCRHLIVRIGLEGALHGQCAGGTIEKARLFFDADSMEGDFPLCERIEGTVFGATSCLAAGLIRQLAVKGDAQSLQSGITAGLVAARHLLLTGLGPVDESRVPTPDWAGLGPRLQVTDHKSGLFLPGVDVPLHEDDARSWTIMAANHAGSETGGPLYGAAAKLALAGTGFLVDAPKARFGNVVTVDRGEIESLRGVRDLMQAYRSSGETKPLSIGVFGPPGAGKSFAVKEIAKGVFGNQVPWLEFNLAQFEGPPGLIGAFHQVRDVAIDVRMQQVPVVFWDEFDSRDYFWLQYLLAPMQDGKFLEGQVTHPIGRAVFVFAGGTSVDFESFGPRETDADAINRFRLKKGPDFRSRLSGYLNVLGPNRRTRRDAEGVVDDPGDIAFPIRRALLLRAFFGAAENKLLDIDRGLLGALLELKKYKHGSRSVERITHLLKTHGDPGRVRRSSLPTAEVVSLHAELGEIEELCRRDFAFRFHAPKLAPAFHGFYRDLCKRNGWAFTYDVDYEQLPDEIKSDNIAAADRLPFVLSLAPLWLAPEGEESIPAKKAQEIIRRRLEILAEAEHDGWMQHKLRNGWRQGPRDNAKHVHDLLVPYRRLSENEKDKDRENVLRYPEIAAMAGYGVVERAEITSQRRSR